MSDATKRPAFANNDEAVAYMKKVAVEQSGFTRHLGVEPITCWQGVAELRVVIREDMTQHHGYAHGAIVGMMADNACAWAAASVVGDVVTGGYTINFLNPAIGTHLYAKGMVVKAGRRQVIVCADVWAEADGKEQVHVATAQAAIIPTGR